MVARVRLLRAAQVAKACAQRACSGRKFGSAPLRFGAHAHVVRKIKEPPDARARAFVLDPHAQLGGGALVRAREGLLRQLGQLLKNARAPMLAVAPHELHARTHTRHESQ